MPVLSPVVWIVLIAAALQCATGLGWFVTSTKLDRAEVRLAKCKQDHAVFVDQTQRAGERAAERAKAEEKRNAEIADQTSRGWASAIAVVRADADRRVRNAARGAGGGGVSTPSPDRPGDAEAGPDPIPPAARVAADCAESTVTANYLQDFLERIQGQEK